MKNILILILGFILSGCYDEAPDFKQTWHCPPGSHSYELISKGPNPNNWNSLDTDYTRRLEVTFRQGSDQPALWNIGQWNKLSGISGSLFDHHHNDSGRLVFRSLDNKQQGQLEIASYVYPNPYPLVMTSDFYYNVIDTVNLYEPNQMIVRLNKKINKWIFRSNEVYDTIPRGKSRDALFRRNLGLYHGGQEPAHQDSYIDIHEY